VRYINDPLGFILQIMKTTKRRINFVRAIRIARVLSRATEALGSEDKARNWIQQDVRALGMVKPISLLDSDIGAEQVIAVLGRIETGTYS
jgi:putative toxin-antitoxin system antitoxin component (TIGR02293 family)